MNQDRLARTQFRNVEECLPRGLGHERDGGCLFEAKRLRFRRNFFVRRHRVFRVTAAFIQSDVGINRIARFVLVDLRSGFFDDPGNVVTGNHRERVLGIFREHSRANHSVHRIDTRGDDAHENFVLLPLGPRRVFVFQNFRAAVLVNDDRFHHWLC